MKSFGTASKQVIVYFPATNPEYFTQSLRHPRSSLGVMLGAFIIIILLCQFVNALKRVLNMSNAAGPCKEEGLCGANTNISVENSLNSSTSDCSFK